MKRAEMDTSYLPLRYIAVFVLGTALGAFLAARTYESYVDYGCVAVAKAPASPAPHK